MRSGAELKGRNFMYNPYGNQYTNNDDENKTAEENKTQNSSEMPQTTQTNTGGTYPQNYQPPQNPYYTDSKEQGTVQTHSAETVQQPVGTVGGIPVQDSYNNQSTYRSTGSSSYTWGNGAVTENVANRQGTPYYAPPPKIKKEKPKRKRTGLKIVAALMCCIMVSLSSVGAFVLLIQNGVVDVGGSESQSSPAFTINKVIDDTETNATSVSSSVSELTPQQVADKMIPSVVCIQTYNTQQQNYMYNFFGDYSQDSTQGDAQEDTVYSQGSGIIYTADGYIITNAHVIADATNIKVVTSEGMTYEAAVVGSDEATDLAVIKIEADGLTPAEFGSSEDLKVADTVMAIGNPGGIEFNSTVTMGYVSALDRQVQSDSASGYSLACIQTDAAINPGNSGGALVNMYGQVVGINSSKIVATGYEGLGFAIPTDTAQPIISDLMQHGYVKDRAMLGISGEYIDSMSARFYGLNAGLYVYSVNTQEAQNSGLEKADVITAINDTQVTSLSVVESVLANHKPGETVELTVERAKTGETLTLTLALSEDGSQTVQQETQQGTN